MRLYALTFHSRNIVYFIYIIVYANKLNRMILNQLHI